MGDVHIANRDETFVQQQGVFAQRIENYYQNLSEPSQSLKNCLRSLAFPEMDNRSIDIEPAAEGTCRWICRHPTYRNWASCDRGLLWVKGKPGSGKSTLLRYTVDDRSKSSAGNTTLVLSFFFYGRGVELQRTLLGLFRSLIHQLLNYDADAVSDLVAIFKKRCRNMGEPGKDWEWHLRELQSFFSSSIQKVLENHSVWLYIDALDECGEENAVELVAEFKTLLRTLQTTSSQFHICFTCRHYPILDLGYGFEICLEDENGRDISTYVKLQLSAQRPSPVPDTIHTTITQCASGVFMWARLVIERILALERRGIDWAKIKDEIHAIPPDLTELYQTHPQATGSCDRCDPTKTIVRPSRPNDNPVIHYGLIASGNKVVEDSQLRDRLGREHRVLCVEMEAAGLMNIYPSLVIRGICDYADSHKNEPWQSWPNRTRVPQDGSKTRPDINNKNDQLAQTQKSICGILEKYQSMAYCTPFDTNQQLTTFQRDKVIQFLSSYQRVEPLEALHLASSFNKRHSRQAGLDLMDMGQFWLHPKFRKWESSNQGALVIIKGDHKSRLAVRSFCINLIELVRKQNAPIIWTLQARNPNSGPNGMATNDVLRDLVCQILCLSKLLQTEMDASVFCAEILATQSPTQWMDLLGKAVSSLPKLYILIETNAIETSSDDVVSAHEKFSLVAAFLRLLGELSRRGCRTRLKVVLVAYATAESQIEPRVAKQHQLVIRTQHCRPTGHSPRGTLLVRRRKL